MEGQHLLKLRLKILSGVFSNKTLGTRMGYKDGGNAVLWLFK
jgi:hypothetical protein